jgi:hypothetical protein
MTITAATTSIIVTNIICALVGVLIWERKGGDSFGAFLLGVFLGVLGLLILAVSQPRQKEIDRVARRRGLVRCPWCAELIRPEARVCRYCGHDLDAASELAADGAA